MGAGVQVRQVGHHGTREAAPEERRREMTGIERLRELVGGIILVTAVCHVTRTSYDREHMGEAEVRLRDLLADIADQIEAEQDVETVRRDAMEAWEWVRRRGGLAQVEMDYAVFEGFSDLADEVARRLDLCIEGLDAQDSRPLLMDALDRRLMPKGIEWPRYESGELVEVGDEVSVTVHDEDGDFERTMAAESVSFDGHGVIISDPYHVVRLLSGERVRRPAPKVLAADGEPLEAGQTVWDTDAESDTPLTVVEVSSDLVRCEYTWKDGKTYRPCYPPSVLTHTKPEVDTWERLEEDAKKDVCVYFNNRRDVECTDCPANCQAGCETKKSRDLVRRAKALAGVSE